MIRQRYFRHGFLTVLVLMLGGPLLSAQVPAPPEKPAALVNGEVIPESEVEKLLKRDKPEVHPIPKSQQLELRKMATDMLIDDALMRQFLSKNATAVTPAEVQKEIDDLTTALATKKTKLEDYLKDSNQTLAQLRVDITARIQWRHYITQKLPDATLKTYYDANKVFFDRVFVRASHILFRYPDRATDADKQVVRSKLSGLRQDILTGKIAFEEAAKQHSECLLSKKVGGDIGPFPYKFAVQEKFARTAFSMKVGEVSDLVETHFGAHIIKVTDRTPGEPSNFEAVKDMVRDVYAQELEVYQNIIAEQRKTAQIQYMN